MEHHEPAPPDQSSGFSFTELEPTSEVASSEVYLDTLHQFLGSLDRWADEIRQPASAEQTDIKKIYYSRLPEALFHATTKERAEQIKATGLRPSQLQFDDNEVVSLSDSIAYAKFCASQTQGVDPAKLVILEVTTIGLDRDQTKSYLQFDNPYIEGEKLHEVHYPKTIDPDWIYELTPDEVAAIEQTEA